MVKIVLLLDRVASTTLDIAATDFL
jgi:hypothetical protein